VTLRVVLADDEPLGRLLLRQLLARHADVAVVGEACDGRDAVALVEDAQPDVLLLDVQMPELDGFGVIAELAAPPPTIFVTAHDSFAVRAFEACALDYLLKPVGQPRFDAALARLRRELDAHRVRELGRRMADLVAAVGAQRANSESEGRTEGDAARPVRPRLRERLVARLGDRSSVIAVDDIDWIEAQDYYAAVHVNAAVHLVRHSLTALEAELDPARFVRIHRSAMVNVSRIRELEHGSELMVVLRTGERLPVSRRRREALERVLGSLA
jgi:two-component system LytT family response regulator